MNNIISPLIGNYTFITVTIACFTAQILKVFIYWIQDKEFNIWHLFEAGGMPSSHSSSVTALTLGIALTQGLSSPLFTASLVFALIVMYDATGVRRAAGDQALILNKLIADYYANEKTQIEKLREILGHEPMEVVAGIFLAIGITFITYYVYFIR